MTSTGIVNTNAQFVSVTLPPNSAGNLIFKLRTFDAASPRRKNWEEGYRWNDSSGYSSKPYKVTELLEGDVVAGDSFYVTVYNGFLAGGFMQFSYTMLDTDTLNSAAAAMASLITAGLNSYGITAYADCSRIIITVNSTKATKFEQGVSLGASATISYARHINTYYPYKDCETFHSGTPCGRYDYAFPVANYPLDNLDATLMITGVCATDNEIQVARKIEEQLGQQLAALHAIYFGRPVFTNQYAPATFRVHRTEHAVCLWSQVAFEFYLEQNETNAIIEVKEHPALATVDWVKRYAKTLSFDFEDDDNDSFTEEQISDIILRFSSFIVNKLGIYVVLSTYTSVFLGNDELAMFLGPTPIYKKDSLIVRFKNRGFTAEETEIISTAIPYPSNLFTLDKQTGRLNFRPDSQIVESNSPIRRGNECVLTYQSGYKNIPEAIKSGMTELIVLDQLGELNVSEMQAGSFKLKLNSQKQLWDTIYRNLKVYKSRV